MKCPTILFGMQKDATKWKQLLRAGQLSGKNLGKIFDAAGVKKVMDYAPSSVGGPTIALPIEDIMHYFALPPSSVTKRTTGGQAVNALKKTVLSSPGGLKDPSAPSLLSTYGTNAIDVHNARKANMSMLDENPFSRDINTAKAQKLMGDLSSGLAKDSGPDAMDHGLYPTYKSMTLDRHKVPLSNMKNDIKARKTELISIFGGNISSHAKNMSIAHKRKTHKIPGSSNIFNKDEFRGKSVQEVMDIIRSDGGVSPFYDPLTKLVTSPVGIGSSATRHEIGHAAFYTGDTKYRIGVIKRLNAMLNRNKDIKSAISKDKVVARTLMDEAFAQIIASQGGSRSAKRFIKDYNNYGRSYRNPSIKNQEYLGEHLDRINTSDPTGVDGAVLSQLVNNYKFVLPKI